MMNHDEAFEQFKLEDSHDPEMITDEYVDAWADGYNYAASVQPTVVKLNEVETLKMFCADILNRMGCTEPEVMMRSNIGNQVFESFIHGMDAIQIRHPHIFQKGAPSYTKILSESYKCNTIEE